MSVTDEPLLLTQEAPDSAFKESVEVPVEPMDIHRHTWRSRLAIGFKLALMTISIIVTTVSFTLAHLGIERWARVSLELFSNEKLEGIKQYQLISVPLVEFGQFAGFALAVIFGALAVFAIVFPKTAETGEIAIFAKPKTVRVDVMKAHQDAT